MDAMTFPFYPNHEYGCEHVGHCPHVGGASLGSVVFAANENYEQHEWLWRQIDGLREENDSLREKNATLREKFEQLKLELKTERQNKFATNKQKKGSSQEPDAAGHPEGDQPDPSPKKRGAPVGHPGWYRRTPTHYDQLEQVPAPTSCPHCQGEVKIFADYEPYDHLQEDVVDGIYQVVLYRHVAARCRVCRRWVQQAGKGEILGARLGPQIRAQAVYLRHEIGISSRKVPQALEELLGMTFTPATLLAFEKMLAEHAEPLVDDIAKKISSSEGAVHADETYWTLEAERAYYWVHVTTNYVHFQFDTSRCGQVSRDVLGEHFFGTLVTDCYAGYEAHETKAKQKCLAHLARTARDWQKLTDVSSRDYTFFEDVKQFVKRGCNFHRCRHEEKLRDEEQAAEKAWLCEELLRLTTCEVRHEKAITLQGRLIKHQHEWLVFLDDPRVPPTNNVAERALRPLVILRKITFGHRSQASAERMAKIMSVKETAKRHGRKVTEMFYHLYTRPPNRALRFLYGG
jgi:transposase